MSANETPLVLFTICAQMAVGSFVVLGAIQLVVGRAVARRQGREALDRLADPALYAIGPVMVLGLAASLLHLGNPMRSLNSLRHFGTSWLSAEIVFGVAFTALGALFALMQWRKWGSTPIRQTLAAVTAVVGIVLVYVMSRVYMLPSQPAWNTWYTPVQFYTTTLLLGGLAVAVALVFTASYRANKSGTSDDVQQPVAASLRWISGAAICLLGVELVTLPVYLLQLMGSGALGAELAERMASEDLGLLITRLVLVFLGAGLLALFLYRAAGKGVRGPSELKALTILTTGAFLLVLVAEIIGRFGFYDLQLHGFSSAWS